jgi:putative hydrolase of the HAD superfamily
MDKTPIRAIAFDFGNTLCPWNEDQYWQITRATLDHICSYADGHGFDSAYDVLSRLRSEDSARNLPRLVENDLEGILRRTAAEIAGRPFSQAELDGVLETHRAAFAGVCHTPEGLPEMLDRLSEKYPLAVISNYSMSGCIDRSLRCMDIAEYFSPVIVSADLGIIKPSPLIFGRLCAQLGLPPEQVLFAGDDWVADVVGARSAGMPCVHVRGGGSMQAETLDRIFGTYLRQALERPELHGWREAKPLAVLHSVLELERWLEEHGR